MPCEHNPDRRVWITIDAQRVSYYLTWKCGDCGRVKDPYGDGML